jgi:hypothetical protein
MRPVKKRHILLVSKDCTHCELAKKDFASRHFGYGEIIDIDSPEGQKLSRDHQVLFVPQDLEVDE